MVSSYCLKAFLKPVTHTILKTYLCCFRYADDMLDCCSPLSLIQTRGITFTEFSCLARCNHLYEIGKRYHPRLYEEFIKDVEKVCKSENQHLVVAFDRASLNQTGDGHFSPIGAFHPQKKLVLVLDVARFKVNLFNFIKRCIFSYTSIPLLGSHRRTLEGDGSA